MRPAVLVFSAAVLMAGCGATNTIRPQGAAESVINVVARQTGFLAREVTCPSGIAAKVGVTFDCHFTGPEPKPYVAYMRIETVHGQRVEFAVNTEPLG